MYHNDSDENNELVALAFLMRGWAVIPICPGTKTPFTKWREFQDRKPLESEVKTWFRRWPNAGLAVVLGPISNLFAIDVDGQEAHEALLRKLTAEPIAPKVCSGSGNPFRYHLYFSHPEIATRARITPWHPQLEFRGRGGFTVLPPTLHKSGNRYQWQHGRTLDDLPLSSLPTAILAALETHNQAKQVAHYSAITRQLKGEEQRDVQKIRGIANITTQFLLGNFAHSAQWNNRLFRAACDLAGNGIAYHAALPLLMRGAGAWNAAEEVAAAKTIASAYSDSRSPARATHRQTKVKQILIQTRKKSS